MDEDYLNMLMEEHELLENLAEEESEKEEMELASEIGMCYYNNDFHEVDAQVTAAGPCDSNCVCKTPPMVTCQRPDCPAIPRCLETKHKKDVCCPVCTKYEKDEEKKKQ